MSLEQGNKPTVYNVAMATGGTEYSQALPINVKKFTFQLRGANDCKLCFTLNASGTTYITIKSGSSYSEDNLNVASVAIISAPAVTLYFQSAVNTQIAEIIAWI